ncbi:LamG-like jellyroll fold domain-containing protein [uncultured Paracoccus sp.]|uniref:LamG-like jellyroll fold domain-containing protein n=1 Tax=uncultured Paracoccus sp. TaxID=189685 RepID=UPI0026154F39|nr:LamG-like jellyroll fold domain-containing protein [uncultured Paracoccus sp.]
MRPIVVGGGDRNTLLLLKGADFVDSSPYQRTITTVDGEIGEANQVPFGNFGPYYDLSGSTTATDKRIDVDDRELDSFYNSAFTAEWWGARASLSPSTSYWLSKGEFSSSYDPPIGVYTGASNVLILSAIDGTGFTGLSSYTLADTDWHHYALERFGAGGDLYLYIDGVLIYQLAVGDLIENTGPLHIGGYQVASSVFGMNGLMDDFRLSRIVRYGGDFTPPGPHKR